MTISALPVPSELTERLGGSPLVLLLDVDGTLSPIAPRPEYATVPPETREVLSRFGALPEVYVAIVSGRSAEDARRMVSVDSVWVIGNHGVETAAPGEAPIVRDDVAAYRDQVALANDRACAIAAAMDGIIVEDKVWTLSVHYRLAHPRVVPDLAKQIERIADDLGLRVTHGKEVLEVRPPIEVDKGVAAGALIQRLGASGETASILCAGDDRTDEDMFRRVREHHPGGVTVHVGADSSARDTSAEFSVPDTEAMRELLVTVLAAR